VEIWMDELAKRATKLTWLDKLVIYCILIPHRAAQRLVQVLAHRPRDPDFRDLEQH
jgi:hypothetical protein